MGFLRQRSLRTLAFVALGLIGVTTFFAVVRLLPWLVRPGVTLGSVSPIAKAILSTCLEVLAVALSPLALGLTVVDARVRREVLTLASLGVSPLRMALALSPLSLIVGVSCAILLWFAPPSSRAVGSFVEALVASSRAQCGEPRGESRPHVATVPLLGYDWLCPEAGEPVLVGQLAPGRWFAARGLSSTGAFRVDGESKPDARGSPTDSIELRDAQVVTRAAHGEPVHMAFRFARLPLESDWFGARRGALWGGIAAPVLSGLLVGPWVVFLLGLTRIQSMLAALLVLVPGPLAELAVMEVGLPGVGDPSWLALCISALVPLVAVSLWTRVSLAANPTGNSGATWISDGACD